jgi:hypothetical protein
VKTRRILAALAALSSTTAAVPAIAQPATGVIRNIVLVHGGFVDGSG